MYIQNTTCTMLTLKGYLLLIQNSSLMGYPSLGGDIWGLKLRESSGRRPLLTLLKRVTFSVGISVSSFLGRS